MMFPAENDNDGMHLMDLELSEDHGNDPDFDAFLAMFDHLGSDQEDSAVKRSKGGAYSANATEDIDSRPFTDPTQGASSDPRLSYADVLVNAFNFVNEQDIYTGLQDIVEPDGVWISSWLNQVKNDPAKIREIHGLRSIASFMSTLVASSPDMVLTIKEKTLYRKPDGSSFLVVKTNVRGNWMLTITMRNALNTGRRLFSRNGFFGRIFRIERKQAETSDGRDVPTGKKTVRLASRNVAQPLNHHPAESAVPQDVIDMETVDQYRPSDIIEKHQRDVAQGNGKRKRSHHKRQLSVMHRDFLSNFRQKRIQPEEVQLGVEGTLFGVERAKQPSQYAVSIIMVCHINEQHRIFKVESFRHLDWRVLLRGSGA